MVQEQIYVRLDDDGFAHVMSNETIADIFYGYQRALDFADGIRWARANPAPEPEPPTLKLEAGKRYVMRSGEVTGALLPRGSSLSGMFPWADGLKGYAWSDKGEAMHSGVHVLREATPAEIAAADGVEATGEAEADEPSAWHTAETERGFREHVFMDAYSHSVAVRESSSAYPHIWIFPEVKMVKGDAVCGAHLTPAMAIDLARRLDLWAKEQPDD